MNLSSKLAENDTLIKDILQGVLSTDDVAQKHGLSPAHLRAILDGRECLDVKERIDAASRSMLDEARRMATYTIKSVLAKELRIGLEGDGETARRCREYALDRFLLDLSPRPGPPQPAQAPPADSPLRSLTAEDLERLGQAGTRPEDWDLEIPT